MALFRLRRSVALWICPELAGQTRPDMPQPPNGWSRSVGASEIIHGLSVGATEHLKALYPPVQNDRNVIPVDAAEVAGHLADRSEQEHLGRGVVADSHCDGQQPHFGQQTELQGGGVNARRKGGRVDHGSLLGGVGTPQGREASGPAEGETQPGQITALISLADTLAAHRGVTHFAISMRALGKGDFFKKLKSGGGCTIRTAEKVVQWFGDNWPADLEWPRSIPRPEKSKKEAA